MTLTRAQRNPLKLGAMLALAAAACSPGPAATGAGATAGLDATPAAATVAPASAAATAAPGAGPKACDLLSDSDIVELGGVSVVKIEDAVMDTIYENHCRWTLEFGEINLGVVSPGGRAFYDERLGIIDGLETVEGLPADIATRQELTGTIFAVKGDTLVDLFTIAVGAPDVELVRRILENLDE